MLKLNLTRDPETYVLMHDDEGNPAITITARPALSEVIEEAKGDPALAEYAEEISAALDESDTLDQSVIRTRAKVGVVFTKAIARAVIDDWTGVLGDDDKPAPITDDNINALLDVPAMYDAFGRVYLAKWLSVEQEKNGSAPSLTGTTAKAQTTANTAKAGAKTAPKTNTRRKA